MNDLRSACFELFGLAVKRRFFAAGLATALIALSGCSSTGVKMPEKGAIEEAAIEEIAIEEIAIEEVVDEGVEETATQGTIDYAAISSNLINAVSQLPELNPLLATVETTAAENDFEQRVHDDMEALGYKVVLVESVQGMNGLAVTAEPIGDNTEMPTRYSLAVGELSAERTYEFVDGQTRPASEMMIRGNDGRDISLNDADIFESGDAAYSAVVYVEPELTEISDLLKPALPPESVEAESALPPILVKRNVFDTLQSNYVSLLEDYEEVDRHILVFPNDSLRLGDANKVTIEQYVQKMNPETDVLSVIGCSHGNTEISNGNSLLALGRANRVKEAFMFSGVEHDQVLEEGCWAPHTFDDVMPQRGVVLTLKRRKEG